MTGSAAPRRGKEQRVGIIEGWELRQTRQAEANSGAWKGFAFVAIALVLLVVGGWFAARPVLGPALTDMFQENPGIIRVPVVADLLRAELTESLNTPAGTSGEEVKFVIEQGETIDDIQEKLVEEGLLTDPVAFKYLVVSDKVDEIIQAGTYTMTPRMTPTDVVSRLAADPDPPTPVTVLRLRPGLRIEQIVAYLQQEVDATELELDPGEFRDIALAPSQALKDEYDFLSLVPKGNSLEGFLAGGTYEVPIDITAEELVHTLLQQWDDDSGDLIAQARKKKRDFYDVLTIASLVEREAKVDKDRAKIAGVYWNRLNDKLNGATGGLMQADPTVVYASNTVDLEDMNLRRWPEYRFWDTLGSDLSTVNVPRRLASHQTYQNAGLPEWPIATPTRKSIQAALNPDLKGKRLFFYACPGSDTHKFAKTAKGHDRNINSCS